MKLFRLHLTSAPATLSAGVLSVLLIIIANFSCAPARADDSPYPKLTFKPGSSTKVYQILGDCDWVEWDATTGADCVATKSRTTTRSDVLGSDLGTSFEHNGRLIFMFGDTIGPTHPPYCPHWYSSCNPYDFMAHDPIAYSTTARAEDGLALTYFPNPVNNALPLLVEPQYPSSTTAPSCVGGSTVPMGGDDTPNAGISIDGQVFIIVGTNANTAATYSQLNGCSILVRFNEATSTFTAGREISQSYYPLPELSGLTVPPPAGTPEGHFVNTALHALLPGVGHRGVWPFGEMQPMVLMYGEGQYRGETSGSSVYLSIIPARDFWSGVDSNGNPATRYFAGFTTRDNIPVWSGSEQDAVPVVYDNPNDVPVPTGPPGFADPGTVGNMSVAYASQLGLWLMTYDGGRAGGPSKTGIYFTYATAPWGPWAPPQLIFNPCASSGYGAFIFYYFDSTNPTTNDCPAAVKAGLNYAGPSGPTIGDQIKNNPATTRGGDYAPFLIERFTEVDGDVLTLYYAMSTWNPYTVVLMQSRFEITRDAVGIRR
jgi:hypothetical protein